MFNYLKSKIGYVLIFFMSMLCLVAAGIAIDVSSSVFGNKSMPLKKVSAEKKDMASNTGKLTNLNKIKEQTFYFNGEKLPGAAAYLSEDKELLLPISDILNKLGVKFNYFSPDDVMEASINESKLTVKLGKGSFNLSGREINLKPAPITARDSILVSQELFLNLKGFDIAAIVEKSPVFLNYYPDFADKLIEKVRLLKIAGGIAGIFDVTGGKAYWDRKTGAVKGETIEFSKDKTVCVIKSPSSVFYIDSKNNSAPRSLNVNPAATLSEDGKYLYWIDEGRRSSYIFDIATGKTKQLGDYYFRIRNGENGRPLLNVGTVISDYSETGRFKRVVLTGYEHDGNYMFIERNGKTVVEGTVSFSPDGRKILFNKNGKYYVVNTDGTGMVLLGDNSDMETEWITDNKILMRSEDAYFIVSRDGKSHTRVYKDIRRVGQTLKGDMLYTEGNTLYCETKVNDKKVADLPWKCDYAFGQSAAGPFIAALSGREDGVYLINGDKVTYVCKQSTLIKSMKQDEAFIDYESKIKLSPDSKYYSVLQSEEGLTALTLANTGDGKVNKIMLSNSTGGKKEQNEIKQKWLSNDRIMVYTSNHGWIIDLKDYVKIHEWAEKEGDSILSIL